MSVIEHMDELIGPDRKWVAAQMALFGMTAVAAPLTRRKGNGAVKLAGIATLAGAGLLLYRANRDLAENLSASPTPRRGGRLIEHGVYSTIRHPMYLAAILGFLGWAMSWSSRAAFLLALATAVFMKSKLEYEEQQLNAHYPEYVEFSERVPARILPGVW